MMDKKVKRKYMDMIPPFMPPMSAGDAAIRVTAYRANNGELCSTFTECVDLNKRLVLEARICKFLDCYGPGPTLRSCHIDCILEWETYKDIESKERDRG